MKNMKSCLTLLLPVIVLFGACSDDDDSNNDPDVSFTSLSQFYAKYDAPEQEFVVFPGTAQTVTGVKGTVVTLPAGALLDAAGAVVTDSVVITLREVSDKPAILYTRTPTQTYYGQPLKSGGMVKISAKVKGTATELRVDPAKPVTVFIPEPDPQAQAGMEVFLGVPDSIAYWMTVWQLPTGTGTNMVFGPNGFTITTDTLTWINSDAPIIANPWITLTANPLEDPFEYETELYFAFPGRTLIHVYRNAANNFAYPFTPTQTDVTIVAIGIKDGRLFSAFVPITTGTLSQTVNIALQPDNEEELKFKIDNLE